MSVDRREGYWKAVAREWERTYDKARDERIEVREALDAAQTRMDRLEEALRVYADPRHWSLRDLSCVWIGPRAYQPFPDAPGVAREALES